MLYKTDIVALQAIDHTNVSSYLSSSSYYSIVTNNLIQGKYIHVSTDSMSDFIQLWHFYLNDHTEMNGVVIVASYFISQSKHIYGNQHIFLSWLEHQMQSISFYPPDITMSVCIAEDYALWNRSERRNLPFCKILLFMHRNIRKTSTFWFQIYLLTETHF